MSLAMKRAGVSPEEIDYITPRTATLLNDRGGDRAMKSVLASTPTGAHLRSKSQTGHLLGFG